MISSNSIIRVQKYIVHHYGIYEILNVMKRGHYELQLRPNTTMHHIFHESCLRSSLKLGIQPLTKLPPINNKINIVWIPKKVVGVHKKQLKNQIIDEVCIKWKGLPIEEATWEYPDIFTK